MKWSNACGCLHGFSVQRIGEQGIDACNTSTGTRVKRRGYAIKFNFIVDGQYSVT